MSTPAETDETGGRFRAWLDNIKDLIQGQRFALGCGLGSLLIPLALGLALGAAYGFSSVLNLLLGVAMVLTLSAVAGGSGLMMILAAGATILMAIAGTDGETGTAPVMLLVGAALLLMLYLHDLSRSLRRSPRVEPAVITGYGRTIFGVVVASLLIGAAAIVAGSMRTWGGVLVPIALLTLGAAVVVAGVIVRRRVGPTPTTSPPRPSGLVQPPPPRRGPTNYGPPAGTPRPQPAAPPPPWEVHQG